MIGILILLAAIVLWTVWGNITVMVSTVAVAGSRVPPEFDGFRIAHISDLHNAEFGEGNAALLERLAGCRPDIIAITGDFVDAHHTDVGVSLAFAREAVRIAPVYYVTGNHEASLARRAEGYAELKAGLEAAGVTVLEDDTVPLEHQGGAVTLMGLMDPSFAPEDTAVRNVSARVAATLDGLMAGETGCTILLSHRPELFDTYVKCGVDLVLSGHAHGGQFRLPLVGGLVAPDQGFFPKYDSGLYTGGITNMVVSRGLGNSIIPVRFNNRPEIVLVELRTS